jgi:hypothetical protein
MVASESLPLLAVFLGVSVLVLCLLGRYLIQRLGETRRVANPAALDFAGWLFLVASAITLLAIRHEVGLLGIADLLNRTAYELATGFLVLAMFALVAAEGGKMALRRMRRA